MKRSEAARYARWSALAAFVLAGATGIIYMRRQWVAHVEIKKAPPPLTGEKERQSIGLTLSKNEGGRTIFTMQASKSIDLKGQDTSLLEDVKFTVFGKLGDRHDVIHTQACNYAKTDGAIQCSGPVDMELQSAADAERAASGDRRTNVIRVKTSDVTFERNSGQAQTVQPVNFWFFNGEGDGQGAVYFSQEGALRLVKDVRMTLRPTEPTGAKPKPGAPAKEVKLRGASMDLAKQSRNAVLYGPATATTENQLLTAGEMTVYLDEQNRAQTLVAAPGTLTQTPVLVSGAGLDAQTLKAESMTASLAPEGWVRSVEAKVNLQGTSANGEMKAKEAFVEMWPRVNQARAVTLKGNVRLDGREPKSGNRRKLATNVLQLNYSGGQPTQHSQLEHSETLERGTMEWTDTDSAQSRLAADHLSVDFAATGKPQHLIATGKVETQRDLKDRPTQTTTSDSGDALLDNSGGWTQMTLRGNVHLKEGDKSGEAEQALFVRATQTSVLTGRAMARDESSETHATQITFHQDTGDIEAEGKVRSTDLSSKKSSVQLSPALSNISADHMMGNSKTGRALYTGHARLWQGPSVLEADAIELLRDTHILHANGNVRATFPKNTVGNSLPAKSPPDKKSAVWHVSSVALTFWDNESRAHLEKNVVVQTEDERMRGPVLDLYFVRQNDGNSRSEGSLQVNRAVSTGGVVVEQGDRRGTAEQGVYTAEDDKFVLSGGTPTLYDASEGTTTGRELTFNMADDTIVVDSGNGTRTVTKHRVQR